ncbi:MAG: hypothetical protein IJH65_13825 [Methanobrevibacter sp.]|nr:hypothetical protein [Methanobrevibacter sp.]
MSYDKKAYKQRQNELKKEIKSIMEDFIPSLIVDPDEMDKYLGNLAGLYGYSLYNQIIAFRQFYLKYGREPEIFQSYGRWKSVNRFVKKSESGVKMVRPQPYKYKKLNELTGDEEEEIGMTWRFFTVFDLSQTDGEPLQRNDFIKGKALMSYDEIKTVVEKEFKVISSPLELEKGATNSEWIRISEKSSENYKISTIIHEVAHNKLGHFERDISREQAEIEAESCAYLVTSLLGLDNQKSKLYINSWSPKAAQDAVKDSAAHILKVAEEIYKTITANNYQLKLL